MYYTYVLLSLKDKKLYHGFTSNLHSRIRKHNEGEVRSTSCRRPLKLIYYEMHLSKSDAIRRERYLKTTKGHTSLRMMLKDYFNDLK